MFDMLKGLLPMCFFIGIGEAVFELFVGVVVSRLNFAYEAVDWDDQRIQEFHQHMVKLCFGNSNVRNTEHTSTCA